MSVTPPTLELALPGGRIIALERVPDHAFDDPPRVAALSPDQGLAYVFATPRRVAFWTVGFERAVDQVFIARSGRVAQVFEHRVAGDESLLGPATDVQVVLELAGGEARRLGLMPGAVLSDLTPDAEPVFDPAADPGFIAIVQSDRAGWFLACELRRRGWRIAHVHHVHHLDEVGEDEFDLELVYADDLDDVLAPLATLGPSLVLAGSELGVNAADYFAEVLYLPGNGTRRSVARRDKAGMVETLHAAGIPVMRQLRTRSWKRIVRWMERLALEEIVVKPVRSAGTDRVARCRTARDVRRAVQAIVGATNRLGLAEVEVVAQERLTGPEIYLNTVSRAGRHAVTEIWLETKRESGGAPFAYDTFQLLPGDDVLAGHLTRWLFAVLDALDIAWGPAHTELILTARGPRLIDFGARLDGVLLPALNEECIGRSPVQLTADALLDPEAWEAWAATPYRLRQHATMVIVDNPRAGILRDDTGLRETARLPTFHALRPRWDVGEVVPATRDAFSYHAIVTLRDADPDAVRRDHATIRAREAAGLLLDVTDAAPEQPAPPPPPFALADPRGSAAWGRALAPFGWSTVQDAPTGVVARRREHVDGIVLWIPRQALAGPLPLEAIERLRLACDAHRVVVELAPGVRILPLVGEEFAVERWDASTEATLGALGLTPTMHEHAPSRLEIAPAPSAPPAVSGLAVHRACDLSAPAIEAIFRDVGEGDAARWPAGLAACLTDGQWALAVIRRASGVRAAALGIAHEGAVHVPVASARRLADLTHLAHALGAFFAAPLVAPGTGVSRLPGGARLALPPALRWARPRWAEHLPDLEGLRDAVGYAPSPSPHHRADVLTRFASREHPLATWGGAAIGQAMGRLPLWTRTAMLFREVVGDAPHGVVPHASRIDLAALAAVARKHDLLWVGWEPPPLGGEIITDDGRTHTVTWDDPARALDQVARLGLYPVRARWTHRKTFVLDLSGTEDDVLARLEPRRRTLLRAELRDVSWQVRVVPVSALSRGDWRAIEAIDERYIEADPARAAIPHPRRAAHGLALGHGDAVVCAMAEDAQGLASYILCLLHDRVAWSMIGTTDPRAAADNPQILLRWHLIRHARAAGCDLMDLYGAWDERFPDEHPDWRGFSRHKALLHGCPVYYPPTLALFA